MREVLDGVHTGQRGPEHQIAVWVDEASGQPAGVVYFGPDPMTDRKWDVWMIAVATDRQGQGIGSELLRYTEAQVGMGGGRLLLTETSSLSKYDATREFYDKHDYREVARIPDFYADGDSKVVYAKRIAQLISG